MKMNRGEENPHDPCEAMLYRALHRVKWEVPDDEAWKFVFDKELEDFFNRYRAEMSEADAREWEANERLRTILGRTRLPPLEKSKLQNLQFEKSVKIVHET